MNTTKRIEKIQKAVQLHKDYTAGKGVTSDELANALSMAIIMVHELTKDHRSAQKKVIQYSKAEKQKERESLKRFYHLA